MNYQVCFVLTTEFPVKAFLLNHLRELSKVYTITVITNTDNISFLKEYGLKVKVVPLGIARQINLIVDFICLLQLIKIFKQENFASVHSVTPKAGLLAMLAAWVVRTPLRIHTFTGQVWANKTGFKRYLLKQMDCIIARLTTQNFIDSPSQRDFLLQERVVLASKTVVFGKGSISGVDKGRFKSDSEARQNIRQRLNIQDDKVLFLFVGRLTRDKGVLDLAQAFNQLNQTAAHLLFVGPDEQAMQAEIVSILGAGNSRLHFVGHTDTPEFYMAAADVLCLPSYREGFGSVVIEAAAVGIPAIASRIYGLTDAVVDGETGLLHEPQAVGEIKNCMDTLISNQEFMLQMGRQAKERAVKCFDSDFLVQEWLDFYQKNIRQND